MNLPVFQSHPACTRCNLHEQDGIRNVGLASIYERSLTPGPGVPAIFFLGQNPGYHEDTQGAPFVGVAGVILRGGWINKDDGRPFPRFVLGDPITDEENAKRSDLEYCEGSYIDGMGLRELASIYLGNIVRCWTINDEKPGWKNHVKPCFPYLLDDLAAIWAVHKPAPIHLFCISAPAVEAVHALLLSDKQDKKAKRIKQVDSFKQQGRSYTFTPSLTGGLLLDPSAAETYTLTVWSTFHPANVYREMNKINAVEGHIQLLVNHLQGRVPAITSPDEIEPRYPRKD